MVNLEKQPVQWNRIFIRFGVLLALALVIYGGFRLYRHYQPRWLCTRAESLLKKRKLKEATLIIRRALQINEHDLRANQIMAEIAEQTNSPDSVRWRERTARLQPGSPAEALAWATAALHYGKPDIAEQALATIPEAGRSTARFHAAAGAVAVSRNKFAEALDHYAKALQLEPQNDAYQFNLASAQIQSGTPETQETGRRSLEQLCGSQRIGVMARHTLIADAAAHGNASAALRHSKELQKGSDVTFQDRLVYLSLLHDTRSAELAQHLGEVQAIAVTKPEDTAVLISWMDRNGMSAHAVEWSNSFPPQAASAPMVAKALAFCHLHMRDWKALNALVKNGDWKSLEYWRFALQALALSELGQRDLVRIPRDQAITLAAGDANATRQLLTAFGDWGWESAIEDLLWVVVNSGRDRSANLQVLYRRYLSERNTEGLYRVAMQILQMEPKNAAAKNNVAMLSLLLRNDIQTAYKLADELYQSDPKNPAFASTYAYSLQMQSRSEKALVIMNTLPQEILRDPSIAAYYAIILLANGATSEAAPFLELAKSAPLLPEERVLLQTVQLQKH
jgi:predicted Zn-dependent protease